MPVETVVSDGVTLESLHDDLVALRPRHRAPAGEDRRKPSLWMCLGMVAAVGGALAVLDALGSYPASFKRRSASSLWGTPGTGLIWMARAQMSAPWPSPSDGKIPPRFLNPHHWSYSSAGCSAWGWSDCFAGRREARHCGVSLAS